MTKKIALISRSADLISKMQTATQDQGWQFAFYDYRPSSDEFDILYWDVESIFPQQLTESQKHYALYKGSVDKTVMFFIIHLKYGGMFSQDQPMEHILSKTLENNIRPSPSELLSAHFEAIDVNYIQSFNNLPRGPVTLVKLYGIATDRFSESIREIKSKCQQKEFSALAALTHKLKSTFGNVGFLRLHVLCHWLELAAEHENHEICVELINKCLDDTYSEAISEWQDLNLG